MASTIETWGMWDIPYRATGVECPDGKRRTVTLTGPADTMFSVPARVTFRGKTVTGFVSHQGMDTDDELDLRFTPNGWGKNAGIFTETGLVVFDYERDRVAAVRLDGVRIGTAYAVQDEHWVAVAGFPTGPAYQPYATLQDAAECVLEMHERLGR